MSKHTIIIGTLIFTAIYFAAVAWVHYGGSDSSLASYVDTHHLNSLGDFLAGVFSPLAFLWLTATVLIQSNELALQRKDLKENHDVTKKQAIAAEKQAEFIGLQIHAMRDQIELQKRVAEANYKANLLGERFANFSVLFDKTSTILQMSPADVETYSRDIQKARLIFGSDLEVALDEILGDAIAFGVLLVGFESWHGEGSFIHYQDRLKNGNWRGSPIEPPEFDSFLEFLQDVISRGETVHDKFSRYDVFNKMRDTMKMETSLLGNLVQVSVDG